MTEYRVMLKRRNSKRYMCFLTTEKADRADRMATRCIDQTMYEKIKVIATDDNGIRNELEYK